MSGLERISLSSSCPAQKGLTEQIEQKVRKSKCHNLDFTFGLFDNVN